MISVYIDEVEDDFDMAIQKLNGLEINSVVLRAINSNKNICELDDGQISVIKKKLAGYKIPAVVSNITTESDLDRSKRAVQIAKFMQSNTICFKFTHFSSASWYAQISQWCVDLNIIPLMEPVNTEIDEITKVLNISRKWKCLLDPAGCILVKNRNFYERFWLPLKDNVYAIDVRDVVTGRGYKPVGMGKSGIVKVIHEAGDSLLFLEPGLGRTYGNCRTRSETFDLAYESFLGVNNGKSI